MARNAAGEHWLISLTGTHLYTWLEKSNVCKGLCSRMQPTIRSSLGSPDFNADALPIEVTEQTPLDFRPRDQRSRSQCSFFGFLHEPFKNGKLLSSWSYHEFISMKFSWNHVKCKWDIKLKNIIIHKIFMKSYFQECFHEYYLHEMFAWILHEDYLMQNSWNFHACM